MRTTRTQSQPANNNPSRTSWIAACAAALLSGAALAGGEQIVVYPDGAGADVAFRLSRDGTTVLRSYFPTPKSPLQNDIWTMATGLVTLPNPPGGAWVASSLNGDGSVIAGRTNPSGALSQGVIYDRTTSSFVPGAESYATCAVASNPPGSPATGIPRYRAFLSKPISGVDFHRPGLGFVPYASAYDTAMPIVQAVGFDSDKCGGYSLQFTGGVLRSRPFKSGGTSGSPLQEIPIPAPDTNAEVVFFDNAGQYLLMTTWRQLPDGTLRYRLVRWANPTDYQIAELPGGATQITVHGVDNAINNVAFSAMTPSGAVSPMTVWNKDDGFMTANNYLVARGLDPGLSAAALGISGDGSVMLAMLSDNTIKLYSGLVELQCGGTASCFSAHLTPGCADTECCQAVCGFDAYCCESRWDAICVTEAQQICLGCGIASSGSCTQPHANPGCSDGNCCTTVCDADPFCCNTEWDSLCADRALATCRTGQSCAEARLYSILFPTTTLIQTTGFPPDGVATPCGSNDTVADWRIVRATCSGVTEVKLCGMNFATSQAVITVYDACGQNAIACSANADPATCVGPFAASARFFSVAGEEYLVRFSAENGGSLLFGAGLEVDCIQTCGTGESCTTSHASAGCNDASCCETVCGADPFCCETSWDGLCAEAARNLCFDPSDLNRDGVIDAADLAILLSGWGTAGPTDINGDGTTDAADLAALLGSWS